VPVSRAAAMGATWFDAGSTLAFVAGATTRIRLLSRVLVLPYRHPLVIAKQYGTLDHLSGGRLILGVGSGHLRPEFKVLGADFERRGTVSDEYLAAIVAAWSEEVARFEGETLAFRDVIVAPRPARGGCARRRASRGRSRSWPRSRSRPACRPTCWWPPPRAGGRRVPPPFTRGSRHAISPSSSPASSGSGAR